MGGVHIIGENKILIMKVTLKMEKEMETDY